MKFPKEFLADVMVHKAKVIMAEQGAQAATKRKAIQERDGEQRGKKRKGWGKAAVTKVDIGGLTGRSGY